MPAERAAPAEREVRVARRRGTAEAAHCGAESQRRRGIVLEAVDHERGAGLELQVEAAFAEPAPRGAELRDHFGEALLGDRVSVEELEEGRRWLDAQQRRVELRPRKRCAW